MRSIVLLLEHLIFPFRPLGRISRSRRCPFHPTCFDSKEPFGSCATAERGWGSTVMLALPHDLSPKNSPLPKKHPMCYIAYQRWSSLVPALSPRREIEMNEPATHLRMLSYTTSITA